MITRIVVGAVSAAIALLWWFVGAGYVEHPGTYRLGILFVALVTVAGAFHVAAFHKFHRMARIITRAEALSQVEPGSAMFAANQRFRYTVRVFEAAWVFGVGVLVILAVPYPQIALNPNYGRFVLTYFIGSIVLTGYLTYRDLWVVHKIRSLDVKLVDAHVDGADCPDVDDA